MFRFISAVPLLLLFTIASGQSRKQESISIVYCNLDDLYDTKDDSYTWDDDFTPEGSKNWTQERYEKKLSGLSERLFGAAGDELPGILILSEVENQAVISDILGTRRFRRANYSVTWFSRRPGMAFLVRDNLCRVIDSGIFGNDLMPDDTVTKASAAYLETVFSDGSKCHFFINSWPGREGGMGTSEPLRIGYAASERKRIDMILNFEPDAMIIVAGTFNDEPTNRSVMSMLNASNKLRNLGARDLYNLYYDKHNFEGKGTVLVNSIWQMYDFFIVSPALLKSTNSYYLEREDGMIAGEADTSAAAPTYRGDQYIGGTGSHLPVYITLKKGNSD